MRKIVRGRIFDASGRFFALDPKHRDLGPVDSTLPYVTVEVPPVNSPVELEKDVQVYEKTVIN